jgi:hypothetical protein
MSAGTKLIEVCEYNLLVVQHALVQRLKCVRAELEILRLSRERELTRIERWELPVNLQGMTREELMEQVDPWITLVDTLEGLIEDFAEKE